MSITTPHGRRPRRPLQGRWRTTTTPSSAQMADDLLLVLEEFDAQGIARAREGDANLGPERARMGREHDDPVGEVDGLGDVVGDVDDGLARLAPDVDQHPLHLVAGERVQRGEGLVHEEDGRVVGQGAGDGHALLHPPAQLVRVGAGKALEVHQGEEALGGLRARRPRHALHLQPELDVALRRAPREELGEVLEDDATVEAPAGDGPAADADLALRRREEAGHDVEQRGLATPAPAHHAEELRLPEAEGHVAQGDDAALPRPVLVGDAAQLDVAHLKSGGATAAPPRHPPTGTVGDDAFTGFQLRTVRIMPQRPTERRSMVWKTNRSKARPRSPMTRREPSITSVLRYSLASKITKPRPCVVAAIISPPTTAIHERAKAWRKPAMMKGKAPGSTTLRKRARGSAPMDSAARSQRRLTERTPVHVLSTKGKIAA